METEREHPPGGIAPPAVVFASALAMRLSALAFIGGSPFFNVEDMRGTDCFTLYDWGRAIAGGDLVGKDMFHQAPLYPYFLALVFTFTGGPGLWAPRVAQAILGALTALMVYFLGARTASQRAGLIGGLLAAAYGPLIFYESTILRSGLLAFLHALLLLLMLPADKRRSGKRSFAAGAVFGLGLLAEATIAVMAPVLVFWTIFPRDRARGLRLPAAALAGFLLVMAPLVVRNLIAGAPTFSLTRRGALEFVNGNLPGAPSSGWGLTPTTLELVARADRKLIPAVFLVLDYHRDDPLALVKRQLEKTAAFLRAYEAPNNVNYYIEREHNPLYRLPLPAWPVILGPALAGMWMSRRRLRAAYPLHAYAVLYSLGVIAFYFLGRFRIPEVPVFCVFAGIGLQETFETWKMSRLRAGALILFFLAVWAASRPVPADPLRPQDYYNQIRFHVIRNEPDRARAWLDRWQKGLAAAPERDRAETLYLQAWAAFTGGAPIAEVRPLIDRARALNRSELLGVHLDILARECDSREQVQDPKPNGFRFLGN